MRALLMLIPPPDNNVSNPEKTSNRTSPRAPWVLILPLALAAGVLLQQSQNTDNATPVTTNAVANRAFQNVPSLTPADDKLRGNPAKYTLFVPDDNGDLRRETVVDSSWLVSADQMAEDSKKVRAQAATKALKTLMQRHAADFPDGAQLLEDATIDDNDRTVLNFNRKFTDASFWQGSTRTLASVYAIVNTAIESQKSVAGESGQDEVQLKVEGKPLPNLGELDTQSPLKTDLKMLANVPENAVNER